MWIGCDEALSSPPLGVSVALAKGRKIPPFPLSQSSLSGSIDLNYIHEPDVRVCSVHLGGSRSSPTVRPDM